MIRLKTCNNKKQLGEIDNGRGCALQPGEKETRVGEK